ncbi:Retrovirus-related Pol polyprotein from transposon opus [Araneus ventricosus]|uniref:Retrovirus-related Pol polyprotein from transposon opus n=1 Tax=Araneus ventricosus TaxID=182803 RepID=A0A4Y2N9D9_ARAVE|nr:Retrovirus-related Pol polyprotein from transposon opus [Araneus ventricosus]
MNSNLDAVLLQSDLDCLFKWCTVNKLHLNIEKCSILSHTRKFQPLNHVYKINDLVLSHSDSFTDLGTIFDTKLDFSQHINSMVSRAYRRLGILKRKTKEFSSEIALKVLYYAHVRSSLEYCRIIWDLIYRNKIEIIERIQNNFLRYLLYKKNGIYLQDVSSSYLRDMFNIPSLCSRRDVSCVLFFYKVINGSIDCTDILSAINFAVPARSLRNQGSFPNVYSRFKRWAIDHVVKISGIPYYLLARAISKIEDNTCLALVMNFKDEPLQLNKNMLLAKVEPVLSTSAEEFVYNVTKNKDKKSFNWEQNHDLSHLDAVEKTKLLKLLEKYDSIFAQNIEKLGECDLVQHQIHLTDNIPTRQRSYRVPYALKPEMRRQINILLEAGIIQPSNSPYAAPVLLVRKPDGSYRLVADLRKLNEKTIPDYFPLSNLTKMVDMLSGAKFFTSMDLTSGFHQMKMHPDHAFLTGIATEFGVFEFKRLPFGLRKARASFQ